MIRLDKYLADMGVGTRTEVKKYIRQGKITVDDTVVKLPDMKIDTEKQSVFYMGTRIAYEEFVYYMLHKPSGVVSATTDKKEKTVIDLITENKRKDLFPVGRLDKDTEGLLLITNDGALAHRLLAPNKHVDKVYEAIIQGIVTEEDRQAFAQGVAIGNGEMAKPAQLEIVNTDEIVNESHIRLTIQEGKFHQVKRMFESVGKKVTYLKRISMGTLVLDETLALGAYRPLTEEERAQLC